MPASAARRQWFAVLATMCYPQDAKRAADGLAPLVSWFDDLPDAAFTKASLEAVVCAPRRMAIPSYDEIRAALGVWWKEHRPDRHDLSERDVRVRMIGHEKPAPPREPPPEELAHAAQLVREAKAHFAAVRAAREASRPEPRAQASRPLAPMQLVTLYERHLRAERDPDRRVMLEHRLALARRHAGIVAESAPSVEAMEREAAR